MAVEGGMHAARVGVLESGAQASNPLPWWGRRSANQAGERRVRHGFTAECSPPFWRGVCGGSSLRSLPRPCPPSPAMRRRLPCTQTYQLHASMGSLELKNSVAVWGPDHQYTRLVVDLEGR